MNHLIILIIIFFLFCFILALCLCMASKNWRDAEHDYELEGFLKTSENEDKDDKNPKD